MNPENQLSTEEEKLLGQLVSGDLSMHRLDKHVEKDRAVLLRRMALERIRDVQLKHIGYFSINENEASKRNIENMIGAVQVPLGIAGPIEIGGEFAQGEYYLPLATTEGAL